MSQITYANKTTLSPQPSIADENKVTADDMNEIKSAVNDNDSRINENTSNISKFGKRLWEGSFSSGSITVDGLSNYTVFIFVLDPTVYCIGSKAWGVGGIGTYASYSTQIYNYRFGGSGDTLTINNENRGGSNGTSNVPVRAIYGLF